MRHSEGGGIPLPRADAHERTTMELVPNQNSMAYLVFLEDDCQAVEAHPDFIGESPDRCSQRVEKSSGEAEEKVRDEK